MRLRLRWLFLLGIALIASCSSSQKKSETWDYELTWKENDVDKGELKLDWVANKLEGTIQTDQGRRELENLSLVENELSANFDWWDREFSFSGVFEDGQFKGKMIGPKGEYPFTATQYFEDFQTIDRSDISYLLADADLAAYEKKIDHAGMIYNFDRRSFRRGERIYNSNCINCHGTPEIDGSIPLSKKFWSQEYKAGIDPYSLYQTITKGIGQMPPQVQMTPREKYDVIHYIREEFIKEENPEQYYRAGDKYLASLPKGNEEGPEPKPYHPWKDQDYGNFFINTYELADTATGPERFHSPGPAPYADEDYTKNNFAYKGIAVRLDEGEGGISNGKAWMVFDHDVMRVAGGWTGEGFIDWKAILLNDQHETYPRNIGDLHFETPVGPAWANPENGSFKDPRFTARDGRQFGPLPKKWADYKGLYHYEDHIIIAYTVGDAYILEELGMEEKDGATIFTRTLNISPSSKALKMRIAPESAAVALGGSGASLAKEDAFHVLNIAPKSKADIQLFIAKEGVSGLEELAQKAIVDDLSQYTSGGGKAHYPEKVKSLITQGAEEGPFAVDVMMPPFDNPWNARLKLSGIDFLEDANQAVACASDGDVWLISGLTKGEGELTWQRIAGGLFQPLGIKVLNGDIFVICRDQLVRLQDFNGDGETDFYESFNHDHQVSDHFHEFAMGLQADAEGNLYYAKSGRHAREALIPQHGTLLKVSKDGAKTEVLAKGFRAANGVCINPDGSFIVTDQQGFWNPMNRINWVEVGAKPKFYGNMWGYDPPKDSTRAGMEPPLVWVDMEFDRSPSELLWVDSEAWGPLNGSLLSFSYGYGIIQLVYNEKVKGQMQGGVITLPGIRFMTGVMRGRFNPEDGHLYACGMSAWATNQMMKGGGLYRIRYTGKPLTVPLDLKATKDGLLLTFEAPLDEASATDISNFEVKTWDIKRTRRYGSKRFNIQTLEIATATLSADAKTISLSIPDIAPVDIMTISYKIKDAEGNELEGRLQNTIHNLGKSAGNKILGLLE